MSRRLAAVSVAAVAALATAPAVLATAPAALATAPTGVHASSPHASSAAGTGHQRFAMTIISVDGKDRPIVTVAAGPITGHGTMTQRVVKRSRAGEVIAATIRLADGKVRLRVHDPIGTRLDRHSCTAREFGKGTWRIVSGTGAYRGVTGKGTFVRRTFVVGAFDSSGRCLGESAPPTSVTGTVVADGTATR